MEIRSRQGESRLFPKRPWGVLLSQARAPAKDPRSARCRTRESNLTCSAAWTPRAPHRDAGRTPLPALDPRPADHRPDRSARARGWRQVRWPRGPAPRPRHSRPGRPALTDALAPVEPGGLSPRSRRRRGGGRVSSGPGRSAAARASGSSRRRARLCAGTPPPRSRRSPPPTPSFRIRLWHVGPRPDPRPGGSFLQQHPNPRPLYQGSWRALPSRGRDPVDRGQIHRPQIGSGFLAHPRTPSNCALCPR